MIRRGWTLQVRNFPSSRNRRSQCQGFSKGSPGWNSEESYGACRRRSQRQELSKGAEGWTHEEIFEDCRNRCNHCQGVSKYSEVAAIVAVVVVLFVADVTKGFIGLEGEGRALEKVLGVRKRERGREKQEREDSERIGVSPSN